MWKYLSRPMGKPTICIGENKGADQLRGNREADQRLCFPPLLNSKISSFSPASMTAEAGLCQPVWKPHCWFSHEVAHLPFAFLMFKGLLSICYTGLMHVKVIKLSHKKTNNLDILPGRTQIGLYIHRSRLEA